MKKQTKLLKSNAEGFSRLISIIKRIIKIIIIIIIYYLLLRAITQLLYSNNKNRLII